MAIALDRVTKEKRSEIMSKVRGKNTSPEIVVRKLLFSLGYRYRIHYRKLPGCPDIAFPGRKKALFVHGCFWHQHGCKKSNLPKTRQEYWTPKLLKNRERDVKNQAALKKIGWDFMVVWQCEIRDIGALQKKMIDFLG